MTDRGDILMLLVTAGRRLGMAEARAVFRSREHEEVLRAFAETMHLADEVERVDPVAGRVLREATYAAMASDQPIEGTATTVEGRALEAGS